MGSPTKVTNYTARITVSAESKFVDSYDKTVSKQYAGESDKLVDIVVTASTIELLKERLNKVIEVSF